MTNLKELMTNGVFGETNNGSVFVIVNDYLVYKSGAFDNVRIMAEHGKDDPHRVVKLVKGVNSFEQYDIGAGTVIYSESKSDDDKDVETLLTELDELLDSIKKDARSKGCSEKEAKAITDTILMAASAVAFKEMLNDYKQELI